MTLIVVVGATGTGKTEFALNLADTLRGTGRAAEIINADSMQLYRGMDIGTAKVTRAERNSIPHHQLDVLEVTEEASVSAYQNRARADIEDIQRRGAVPILVGGSGLYVSAVLHNLDFPGRNPELRAQLEAVLEQIGTQAMFQKLALVDPKTAATIDPANARRIVRALEVFEHTGVTKAARLPDQSQEWQPSKIVHLHCDRNVLTERLDRRVQKIWSQGLLAEVQELIFAGIKTGKTASRAIGYRQAIAQIEGELSETQAIEQTQIATRIFARRQLNWFRRYREASNIDSSEGAVDPNRFLRELEPNL